MARDLGAAITHVFDRDDDRRRHWCGHLDATPLERLDGLETLGAAGALVCSETAQHEADVTAALEAGLPVFCEKPLAADTTAAQRLARLARQTAIALDTGLFLRSQPALQALRGKVQAGALGPVHEASVRFAHDGGFADWLDVTGWMSDPERAVYGGAHAVAAGSWTDPHLRFELEIIGAKGWASVRATADGGAAALYRRGETEPHWAAHLAPLDAGEGSRGFLAAIRDGRTPQPLCPPDEAADLNRILDWCYGR